MPLIPVMQRTDPHLHSNNYLAPNVLSVEADFELNQGSRQSCLYWVQCVKYSPLTVSRSNFCEKLIDEVPDSESDWFPWLHGPNPRSTARDAEGIGECTSEEC
ncbi:hypothetical protein STEG23_001732 [Scotinomys teguina]